MKIKLAGQILLIAGAGLFLTACASDKHESEEVIYQPSGAQAQPAPAQTTAQGDVVIPLHQETIKVGKRMVDSGRVTIRKTVTTETVSEPIELRRESVIIEREGAGAQTGYSTAETGNLFEEKTIVINLQSEEPIIEKGTIVSGRVIARKGAEIEKSTVSRELKRENVQFDKSGENVTIVGEGTVSEPAGAELKNEEKREQEYEPRKGVDDLTAPNSQP